MNNLLYCPVCGKESLTCVNNRKWYCTDCDFTLFHNIAAAVAVIIRVDNEIFLTQRAIAPQSGYLDLPGGFSDPDESVEQTCVRELKEELGLSFPIRDLRYLGSMPNRYPYKGIVYATMDLFFELNLKQKFVPEFHCTEINNGMWVHVQELDLAQIAFESQKDFLKNYTLGDIREV